MEVTPVNNTVPNEITVRLLPQGQPVVDVKVPAGTTVAEFISTLSEQYPAMTNNQFQRRITRIGVYENKLVDYVGDALNPTTTILQDGDVLTTTGKIEGGR